MSPPNIKSRPLQNSLTYTVDGLPLPLSEPSKMKLRDLLHLTKCLLQEGHPEAIRYFQEVANRVPPIKELMAMAHTKINKQRMVRDARWAINFTRDNHESRNPRLSFKRRTR